MAAFPAPAAQVTRFQGDLQDPDTATAQTVEVMCNLIDKASQDPVLQSAARDAVNRFKGGPMFALAGVNPWTSQAAQACSAWWWTKQGLKFIHHDGLIQVWLGERDQLQLLVSPDLLLRMKDPRGDCAIYTMLECAMLKALGIQYQIVTAAVTPESPVYDHVWGRAVLSDGRQIDLDASHGDYPGWQVPYEHRNRTQVWDSTANPIEDRRQFRGLHAFQARPNTPILPRRLALVPGVPLSDALRQRGMGIVRRRGLGQDYSESSSPTAPLASAGTVDTSYIPSTTPTTSAPNPFTQALANAFPGLLQQWTTIGGRVIAPTVQYQGPGGISYSAPAGSAAASALPLSIGTLNTTSILPILLLGGGALLLIMLATKK